MASHLFLLFFCHLLFTTADSLFSQSDSTIPAGSSLYTSSTPNFWPSPSGCFAFGFYPFGNGFKVGIWLKGSTGNTVVWTAQRDNPELPLGSFLLFSVDSGLTIHGPNGSSVLTPVSETIQRSTGASVATMLDTGNFVLYDRNSQVVWSSFDHPTDTLLGGQKLLRHGTLFSSVSKGNHSTGNFKLSMQGDGNLNAFPVHSLREGRYAYWTSNTQRIGENVSLNLAVNGWLHLQNSSGFVLKNLTKGVHSVNDSFIYRATFEADGNFRLYQHRVQRNGSSSSSILWRAISEDNRCFIKGTCGLNSYCSFNGAEISCLCPPGFDFIDPNQSNKGCYSNFSMERDCFEGRNNGSYEMISLENTAWEREEYEILELMSEESCSKACLDDCNCRVATFRDQMCFKNKLPLRFGRHNISNPTKAFIKIGGGDKSSEGTKVITNKITKRLGKKFVIAGIGLVTSALILFMVVGFFAYTNRRWAYKIIPRRSVQPDVIEEVNLRSFRYEQLVVATDNFKEEIGRGASGRVYKGSLTLDGGKKIAVKKLEKLVEDKESEFRNEMRIIGRTHHKNLVRLIGFCCEGSNRLLVYEFMKNGSLGDIFFKSRNRPAWTDRKRILLDVAKGLHYLHEDCEIRIVHCDIKPHNILLDESWGARISDFGLSKLLKPDQTRTYTMPGGTSGYEAPEWHKKNAPLTVKADVYSFGVLLFEILCCRKNMDYSATEEEVVLMDRVSRCYESGELEKLIGEEEMDKGELERVVKVGLLCLQTNATLRPTMNSVILMLEGSADPPLPPPLTSSSSN